MSARPRPTWWQWPFVVIFIAPVALCLWIRDIHQRRKKKTHPEDYCHRCGGRNMSWHTDNETWNELTRVEGQEVPGIICPLCLDELDREKRDDGSHWYITKETLPPPPCGKEG